MEFGINKYATMIVRPDTPYMSRNKREFILYITGQQIPTTDCYTYLGIPFDKYLPLVNNSIRKALFSIGRFLRNSGIPLPFKQ